ncbi:unnamed protein product [Amoebophrya sp. A120]|nr:unnamed protein product [Amoebophrya sp. A120]|eukprot:GSA120T00016406001.1
MSDNPRSTSGGTKAAASGRARSQADPSSTSASVRGGTSSNAGSNENEAAQSASPGEATGTTGNRATENLSTTSAANTTSRLAGYSAAANAPNVLPSSAAATGAGTNLPSASTTSSTTPGTSMTSNSVPQLGTNTAIVSGDAIVGVSLLNQLKFSSTQQQLLLALPWNSRNLLNNPGLAAGAREKLQSATNLLQLLPEKDLLPAGLMNLMNKSTMTTSLLARNRAGGGSSTAGGVGGMSGGGSSITASAVAALALSDSGDTTTNVSVNPQDHQQLLELLAEQARFFLADKFLSKYDPFYGRHVVGDKNRGQLRLSSTRNTTVGGGMNNGRTSTGGVLKTDDSGIAAPNRVTQSASKLSVATNSTTSNTSNSNSSGTSQQLEQLLNDNNSPSSSQNNYKKLFLASSRLAFLHKNDLAEYLCNDPYGPTPCQYDKAMKALMLYKQKTLSSANAQFSNDQAGSATSNIGDENLYSGTLPGGQVQSFLQSSQQGPQRGRIDVSGRSSFNSHTEDDMLSIYATRHARRFFAARETRRLQGFIVAAPENNDSTSGGFIDATDPSGRISATGAAGAAKQHNSYSKSGARDMVNIKYHAKDHAHQNPLQSLNLYGMKKQLTPALGSSGSGLLQQSGGQQAVLQKPHLPAVELRKTQEEALAEIMRLRADLSLEMFGGTSGSSGGSTTTTTHQLHQHPQHAGGVVHQQMNTTAQPNQQPQQQLVVPTTQQAQHQQAQTAVNSIFDREREQQLRELFANKTAVPTFLTPVSADFFRGTSMLSSVSPDFNFHLKMNDLLSYLFAATNNGNNAQQQQQLGENPGVGNKVMSTPNAGYEFEFTQTFESLYAAMSADKQGPQVVVAQSTDKSRPAAKYLSDFGQLFRTRNDHLISSLHQTRITFANMKEFVNNLNNFYFAVRYCVDANEDQQLLRSSAYKNNSSTSGNASTSSSSTPNNKSSSGINKETHGDAVARKQLTSELEQILFLQCFKDGYLLQKDCPEDLAFFQTGFSSVGGEGEDGADGVKTTGINLNSSTTGASRGGTNNANSRSTRPNKGSSSGRGGGGTSISGTSTTTGSRPATSRGSGTTAGGNNLLLAMKNTRNYPNQAPDQTKFGVSPKSSIPTAPSDWRPKSLQEMRSIIETDSLMDVLLHSLASHCELLFQNSKYLEATLVKLEKELQVLDENYCLQVIRKQESSELQRGKHLPVYGLNADVTKTTASSSSAAGSAALPSGGGGAAASESPEQGAATRSTAAGAATGGTGQPSTNSPTSKTGTKAAGLTSSANKANNMNVDRGKLEPAFVCKSFSFRAGQKIGEVRECVRKVLSAQNPQMLASTKIVFVSDPAYDARALADLKAYNGGATAGGIMTSGGALKGSPASRAAGASTQQGSSGTGSSSQPVQLDLHDANYADSYLLLDPKDLVKQANMLQINAQNKIEKLKRALQDADSVAAATTLAAQLAAVPTHQEAVVLPDSQPFESCSYVVLIRKNRDLFYLVSHGIRKRAQAPWLFRWAIKKMMVSRNLLARQRMKQIAQKEKELAANPFSAGGGTSTEKKKQFKVFKHLLTRLANVPETKQAAISRKRILFDVSGKDFVKHNNGVPPVLLRSAVKRVLFNLTGRSPADPGSLSFLGLSGTNRTSSKNDSTVAPDATTKSTSAHSPHSHHKGAGGGHHSAMNAPDTITTTDPSNYAFDQQSLMKLNAKGLHKDPKEFSILLSVFLKDTPVNPEEAKELKKQKEVEAQVSPEERAQAVLRRWKLQRMKEQFKEINTPFADALKFVSFLRYELRDSVQNSMCLLNKKLRKTTMHLAKYLKQSSKDLERFIFHSTVRLRTPLDRHVPDFDKVATTISQLGLSINAISLSEEAVEGTGAVSARNEAIPGGEATTTIGTVGPEEGAPEIKAKPAKRIGSSNSAKSSGGSAENKAAGTKLLPGAKTSKADKAAAAAQGAADQNAAVGGTSGLLNKAASATSINGDNTAAATASAMNMKSRYQAQDHPYFHNVTKQELNSRAFKNFVQNFLDRTQTKIGNKAREVVGTSKAQQDSQFLPKFLKATLQIRETLEQQDNINYGSYDNFDGDFEDEERTLTNTTRSNLSGGGAATTLDDSMAGSAAVGASPSPGAGASGASAAGTATTAGPRGQGRRAAPPAGAGAAAEGPQGEQRAATAAGRRGDRGGATGAQPKKAKSPAGPPGAAPKKAAAKAGLVPPKAGNNTRAGGAARGKSPTLYFPEPNTSETNSEKTASEKSASPSPSPSPPPTRRAKSTVASKKQAAMFLANKGGATTAPDLASPENGATAADAALRDTAQLGTTTTRRTLNAASAPATTENLENIIDEHSSKDDMNNPNLPNAHQDATKLVAPGPTRKSVMKQKRQSQPAMPVSEHQKLSRMSVGSNLLGMSNDRSSTGELQAGGDFMFSSSRMDKDSFLTPAVTLPVPPIGGAQEPPDEAYANSTEKPQETAGLLLSEEPQEEEDQIVGQVPVLPMREILQQVLQNSVDVKKQMAILDQFLTKQAADYSDQQLTSMSSNGGLFARGSCVAVKGHRYPSSVIEGRPDWVDVFPSEQEGGTDNKPDEFTSTAAGEASGGKRSSKRASAKIDLAGTTATNEDGAVEEKGTAGTTKKKRSSRSATRPGEVDGDIKDASDNKIVADKEGQEELSSDVKMLPSSLTSAGNRMNSQDQQQRTTTSKKLSFMSLASEFAKTREPLSFPRSNLLDGIEPLRGMDATNAKNLAREQAGTTTSSTTANSATARLLSETAASGAKKRAQFGEQLEDVKFIPGRGQKDVGGAGAPDSGTSSSTTPAGTSSAAAASSSSSTTSASTTAKAAASSSNLAGVTSALKVGANLKMARTSTASAGGKIASAVAKSSSGTSKKQGEEKEKPSSGAKSTGKEERSKKDGTSTTSSSKSADTKDKDVDGATTSSTSADKDDGDGAAVDIKKKKKKDVDKEETDERKTSTKSATSKDDDDAAGVAEKKKKKKSSDKDDAGADADSQDKKKKKKKEKSSSSSSSSTEEANPNAAAETGAAATPKETAKDDGAAKDRSSTAGR